MCTTLIDTPLGKIEQICEILLISYKVVGVTLRSVIKVIKLKMNCPSSNLEMINVVTVISNVEIDVGVD